MVSDQRAKFHDARANALPANVQNNFLLGALVKVIRNHGAGLEVYVGPNDGVADEVQVSERRGVENDRGFELAAWPDRCLAVDEDACRIAKCRRVKRGDQSLDEACKIRRESPWLYRWIEGRKALPKRSDV